MILLKEPSDTIANKNTMSSKIFVSMTQKIKIISAKKVNKLDYNNNKKVKSKQHSKKF